MARITKETLERIIREVYGIEIPDNRLKVISRVVGETLEALQKSSEVELEDVEPASAYDASEH